MNIRQQYEKLEEKILSPYAIRSIRTRGRQRKEKKCSIRTDFQRDRDRIVHSRAFRRLKHKTQVFIKPELDHYRTRLTHTLEVSQISRTIARALRLNEDLTEAIALGHDLGHTPFGHLGEEVLDKICKLRFPPRHFSHAEQSLRVVDFLENKGRGLNLTWEVRDGILHHTKGNRGLDDAELIRPSTLEGKVVMLSDRIAYINHDIADAIRDGIIKGEGLPQCEVKALGKSQGKRIDTLVKDVIKNSKDKDDVIISEEKKYHLDKLKDYLFERVYYKLRKRQRKIEEVIYELFEYYLKNPPDPLRGYPRTKDEEENQRNVCDYISGMTDNYALLQYNKIFGKKICKKFE